ncbi:glycosyltransferase family 2 protein [Halogeometricum luteum]|uniref:Glycosyltransferase family 2 protein n=1 Tax=Halogeometricum luteum TaxID=2950537 RepID=A0ABU2G368_9EURY|nr:glycosyltransferase family 2 protein [Halogeometricum sp. S3BR5-2]MDS0295230.1 glycosyltransferase family 2 protein [Halogeometricum sp. S3BR5-2]
MYKNATVGLVVPAYNEEGKVGTVIDTVPAYVDRIYVVDDGSTDGTWAEITAHADEGNRKTTPEADRFDERFVPIRHEENRGVGGAIKTGYLRAREERIDVTAVVGGDGQMHPDELGRYLDPIVDGTAEYAKGSRFSSPEDMVGIPPFRLVGNLTLSYLTKYASGYWFLMDSQNGYAAISLHALEEIDLEGMYEYYGYCNDLLVKLNLEDLRVADVPRSAEFAYSEGWDSHIDYAEYVPRVSWMLLRNFVGRLYRKHLLRERDPFVLCYGAGVGLVLKSIRDRVGSGDERSTPWLSTVGGVLLFLLGTLLDARANRDLCVRVDRDSARGDDAVQRRPTDRQRND